jgi:hypothetical protein
MNKIKWATITCPHCGGTGEEPGTNEECEICWGSQYIEALKSEVKYLELTDLSPIAEHERTIADLAAVIAERDRMREALKAIQEDSLRIHDAVDVSNQNQATAETGMYANRIYDTANAALQEATDD